MFEGITCLFRNRANVFLGLVNIYTTLAEEGSLVSKYFQNETVPCVNYVLVPSKSSSFKDVFEPQWN